MCAGSANGDWRAGLQHDAGVVQDGLRALQSLLGDAAAITIAAAARTIAAAAAAVTSVAVSSSSIGSSSFTPATIAHAAATATPSRSWVPLSASGTARAARTCAAQPVGAVCIHPRRLLPNMPASAILHDAGR